MTRNDYEKKGLITFFLCLAQKAPANKRLFYIFMLINGVNNLIKVYSLLFAICGDDDDVQNTPTNQNIQNIL